MPFVPLSVFTLQVVSHPPLVGAWLPLQPSFVMTIAPSQDLETPLLSVPGAMFVRFVLAPFAPFHKLVLQFCHGSLLHCLQCLHLLNCLFTGELGTFF